MTGPDPDTFLSGHNGLVVGPRLRTRATLADAGCALSRALTLTGPRLDRLAARQPSRRVLVTGVYRPGSRLATTIERLTSDAHDVTYALGSTAAADPALEGRTTATDLAGGKFENLNALLPKAIDADWVIVTDDDIDLPPRFLDRLVAIAERLELDLAQPAQSRRSHAAWAVTRTRPFSLARRTNYVEIGPLTLFSQRAAQTLMPFPALRFGWGLDNHWGALATEHGWGMGVIDALVVRHEFQPIAATYTHAEAKAEGSAFLDGKPFVPTTEAQRTVETVRRIGA